MTLQEFINQTGARNAHVKHRDFKTLYVRHAHHVINGEVHQTFDIASVESKRPGRGAFTRLLEQELNDLDKTIYVESVLNPKFACWLERNGFILCGEACYARVSPKIAGAPVST